MELDKVRGHAAALTRVLLLEIWVPGSVKSHCGMLYRLNGCSGPILLKNAVLSKEYPESWNTISNCAFERNLLPEFVISEMKFQGFIGISDCPGFSTESAEGEGSATGRFPVLRDRVSTADRHGCRNPAAARSRFGHMAAGKWPTRK